MGLWCDEELILRGEPWALDKLTWSHCKWEHMSAVIHSQEMAGRGKKRTAIHRVASISINILLFLNKWNSSRQNVVIQIL